MDFFKEIMNVNRPSKRKQIFSEYKLPDDPIKLEDRVQISKDRKNSNQTLIRQLALFKFNLYSVLQLKNAMLGKFMQFEQNISKVHNFLSQYNQGQLDYSEEIERKFRSIQQIKNAQKQQENLRSTLKRTSRKQSSQRLHPNFLMQSLIIYKQFLSDGQSLKYQASAFRIGTISNFNPKHTQPKFSKSVAESQESVNNYIRKIIAQSSKAIQSKVRIQNNYEKDRFLIEEDKYNCCWKSLEDMYHPKQVEFIHFQMLNILNAFDLELERLSSILQTHRSNYKKYQGVADSMNLMKKQIEQMSHIIKSRDQIIENFLSRQFRQSGQMERMVQKCNEEDILIQKNIKIYHINQKLFTLYNTETNLKSYSRSRNNFIQKLQELTIRLDIWKVQYSKIKEIAQKYCKIDEIINKKFASLGSSQYPNGSQSIFEIQKLIVQIEEIHINKDSKVINFKNSVLDEIRHRLKESNLDNRAKTRTSSSIMVSTSENSAEIQLLERQKSFLFNLAKNPPSQKKIFMINNSEKIRQHLQYNKKKKEEIKIAEHLRSQIKKFYFQFCILQQINNVNQSIRQIIFERTEDLQMENKFSAKIKNHLNMIEGQIKIKSQFKDIIFEDLIYKHILDYNLFQSLFKSDHWIEFIRKLQKNQDSSFLRSISFSSQTSAKTLKELIKITKSFLKQNYHLLTINMLKIFSQSLFRLEDKVSLELFLFQEIFWNKITGYVAIFYEKNNLELNHDIFNKSIDNSSFFTLPYLIHLNKTSKKNKVLNLDECLTKITKSLYDHFDNLREQEVLENAICVTYIIRYIRKICEQEDFICKFVVLSKLRRMLTSQLLKSQFAKLYEFNLKAQKYSKNQISKLLLGFESFITFDDGLLVNSKKKSNFEIQNFKYLKLIEQQIKPLIITISISFPPIQNIPALMSLWTFQTWISESFHILSNSQSYHSCFIVSHFFTLREKLHDLLNIIQSPQLSGVKQSDGFLVKMINRQNFYMKKQINKFKLLKKQNIWEQFNSFLRESIQKVQSLNINLNQSQIVQFSQKIYEIHLKSKNILINIDKK